MESPSRDGVTQLLVGLNDDRAALDQLFPLLYPELRRIARRQLARERSGATLDSVGLIHETYLRLVDHDSVHWENRAHFFAVAARAMRRILVDHARASSAAKRGRGAPLVTLDRVAEALGERKLEHLLHLEEALTRLTAISEEAGRVVECRYFAGLTLEEVAAALNLSVATVRRRWGFAKAWLHRELSEAS